MLCCLRPCLKKFSAASPQCMLNNKKGILIISRIRYVAVVSCLCTCCHKCNKTISLNRTISMVHAKQNSIPLNSKKGIFQL